MALCWGFYSDCGTPYAEFDSAADTFIDWLAIILFINFSLLSFYQILLNCCFY